MREWHAIGFFCEDIREEKNDIYSLIGILPDNIKLNEIPTMIPKLGIYTRFHLSPTSDIEEIKIKLRFPDGQEAEISTIDNSLIKKTQRDTIEQGAAWSSILNRGVAALFPVPAPGRILLIATIDGEEMVCGSLNIVVDA